MMRSTVTQVAVATLAISMFICNSESTKSFDGTSGDVRVRIEVKIPDEGSSAAGPEEEVFIAGNIKQLGTWQPKGLKLDRTEANVFGADFSVPVGTRMQFKVTRGSGQTVEKDKLGKDIANREVVATASEDGVPQKVSIVVERWGLSRPVKSTATGTMKLHDQFASKNLTRSRNVSVWLPPEYEESNQKFSVLYLQDGKNLFDNLTSAFGEEWRVDKASYNHALLSNTQVQRSDDSATIKGIPPIRTHLPTCPGETGHDEILAYHLDRYKSFILLQPFRIRR
jgi:hypothetical protein